MSKRDMVRTFGTLKSLSWEFQVCKTQSWHPLELSKRRVSNKMVPGEHPAHTMESWNPEQSRQAVSRCIPIALAALDSGYTVPGTDCGSPCVRTTQSVYSQCFTTQTFCHLTKLWDTWRWMPMGFILCHLQTTFSTMALDVLCKCYFLLEQWVKWLKVFWATLKPIYSHISFPSSVRWRMRVLLNTLPDLMCHIRIKTLRIPENSDLI